MNWFMTQLTLGVGVMATIAYRDPSLSPSGHGIALAASIICFMHVADRIERTK